MKSRREKQDTREHGDMAVTKTTKEKHDTGEHGGNQDDDGESGYRRALRNDGDRFNLLMFTTPAGTSPLPGCASTEMTLAPSSADVSDIHMAQVPL